MNTEILNPLRWKRSYLYGVLIGFLVLWFGFFDNYSLWTRYSLNQERAGLEQEIERMQEETRILEARIESLENDAAYLERIAREEYGMRREGEVIYQVQE